MDIKRKPLKTFVKVLVLALIVFGLAGAAGVRCEEVTLSSTPATVCFTPGGPCEDDIVKEIDRSSSTIFVQAYSFTSEPIADALIKAFKRGVTVWILLDKSQETANYSQIDNVVDAGIPTYIDNKHSIAHNKIMIIDKETVITGSFNFTYAAENKNAENVIIIRSQELAKPYIKNFKQHKGHSVLYRRQSGTGR
jgi:phosphatidylserine/phosphatidylglycerophosphate/cardiolipin synthase-like enzyme